MRVLRMPRGVPKLAMVTSATATLLAAGFVAASPSGATNSAPFTIVADTGTTGYFGSLGAEWDAGLAAAAGYWNSKGGILGHKFKIVYLNNNSDPSTAVNVLDQYLATNPKPNAVIGGQESSIVASLFPLLAQKGIMGFAASAGGAESQAETNASKVMPEQYVLGNSTALSGKALGYYTMLGHHYNNVGLLQETAPFFAAETAQVQAQIAFAGGTSEVVQADPTALSLVSEASQLQADGVKAVVLLAAGTTAGYALQALASVGLNVPVYGDVGVSSGPVTSLVPAADYANLKMVTYPDETSVNAPYPGTAATVAHAVALMTSWLVKTGNKTFLTQPYSNTGVGWDTLAVLETAAKQAKSIAQSKLVAALDALKVQSGLYVSDAKYKYTKNNHENADASLKDFGLTPAALVVHGQFLVKK